ncbi:S8 family peptidase [Sphingorhabdus wooponensis]|nr:S8 family peptidase [Sphingorhabdus wooponensis]
MHEMRVSRKLAIGSSAIFALALSGCGGGGVSSIPVPPPPTADVPPPPLPTPPPPPPPPTTTSFATSEYLRSDGPDFHRAITAYQAGASGRGVTVGIIDSGIDPNSHEFSGRIHAQSGDVTGADRPLGDDDGHGTSVSRVLAAAKNDRDIHGMAFNATILALRADQAGSCISTDAGVDEAGCSFFDSAIAAGVDRAVDNKARVINISLGGAGGASSALRSAIHRATSAGVVVVVSAGNEGDKLDPAFDPNSPSPFAQALLANGNGLVIIATAVDDDGNIAKFSNKAGVVQNAVLSALGQNICCEYRNDTIYRLNANDGTSVRVYNGTSYAAPQIAGAAALLAQAFPNLTGAQIVNLLLTSARDAGAQDTDAIYGRGILDIGRAFAPAGTTLLAGTNTAVARNGNGGTTSMSMGDAASSLMSVNAVVLDSYGRAYDINVAEGISPSAPRLQLTPALADQSRSVSMLRGTTELAFSISAIDAGGPRFSPLLLSDGQQNQARILAGRVSAAIARETRFSLGIRQAAASQVAALQGMSRAAFLTATDAQMDGGFDRAPRQSLALRRQLGGFGLTGSVETGQARIFERGGATYMRGANKLYSYSSLGLSLDRQIGSAKFAVGAHWMREDETVLGARFANFIGQNGARSLFVDGRGDVSLNGDWSLGASWRQGWTKANAGASLASQSLMKNNAFSLDLSGSNVLSRHDRVAFRIAQPLRVTSGGLALHLPVAYDYATLATTFAARQISLAPKGQEITSELIWGMPIYGGHLSSNLFWRQEPGHFENAPDDVGIAFRLQFDF